jgi:hypothetical protein
MKYAILSKTSVFIPGHEAEFRSQWDISTPDKTIHFNCIKEFDTQEELLRCITIGLPGIVSVPADCRIIKFEELSLESKLTLKMSEL